MTRPLRIQFPGALYHVMARGDRRRPIFHRDDDYRQWLTRLASSCERFNAIVHAYCLMPNHYHLMIETPDANLSKVVGHLNTSYSQLFNRRYELVGHVFQGRFKAILVQRDAYLIELARYIILNPVRARLIDKATDWQWSSFGLMMAAAEAPSWFNRDCLLHQFGQDPLQARQTFCQFISEGLGRASPLRDVKHQLVLGDQTFVAQHTAGRVPRNLRPILKTQRGIGADSLDTYQQRATSRDEAMCAAYRSKAFTMHQIAVHFHTHRSTVSRAIRAYEQAHGVGAHTELD